MSRELVQRGYDQVAQAYAGLLELKGHEWPRLRRLRELLDELPASSRVLDVGCGNGIPALSAPDDNTAATCGWWRPRC